MNNVYSGSLNMEISQREINNRLIARKAAEEGIVLLHNNGVLPIKKTEHISLFGTGAKKTVKGGNGSGDVNGREVVSIYDGLVHKNYVIDSEEWLDLYDDLYEKKRNQWRDSILSLGDGDDEKTIQSYIENPFRMPECIIDKLDCIEEHKIAIYVISRMAGEGSDRKKELGDYELTEIEKKNINLLSEVFEDLIIVINSGGLIDLSEISSEKVSAILLLSQPGMEGGNALANIISGEISPSGKLTDSIPYKFEDYPDVEKFRDCEKGCEYYREGIFVGYKYFDRANIKPRYPLGFGLSYTDFHIKLNNFSLSDKKVTLEISVKNIGDVFSGKEVVQVYVFFEKGKLLKEKKRLVNFKKTDTLKPGNETIIKVDINMESLKSYDEKEAKWVIEKGIYCIAIGNSSSNLQKVLNLRFDNDVIITYVKNRCVPQSSVRELYEVGEYDEIDMALTTVDVHLDYSCDMRNQQLKDEKTGECFSAELYEKIRKLSNKELASLVIGSSKKEARGTIGAASYSVPGAAGETTSVFVDKPYHIKKLVMADGPAGLRLRKSYYVDKCGQIENGGMLDSIENGIFSTNKLNEKNTIYYQFCTAFPVGTMIAQTFNEELAESIGKIIESEMEEFGIDIWLAPGINIHRNVLCGRSFEYYSEDPVISGKIASAVIRGVQEKGNKCACVKHFACNNTEYKRKKSNSVINEKALREEYLTAFEIAVSEAKPKLVMSAYNKVNGIYAANNYDLCTGILREEWKFDGVVVSDWTTTNSGGADAALCINAGNDLIMPGYESDFQEILSSVNRERKITINRRELEISACRIAKLAYYCDNIS